jgi:hypothetical protein
MGSFGFELWVQNTWLERCLIAYDVPGSRLVGVLRTDFAACAWTEISSTCLAPALVFERLVQAS